MAEPRSNWPLPMSEIGRAFGVGLLRSVVVAFATGGLLGRTVWPIPLAAGVAFGCLAAFPVVMFLRALGVRMLWIGALCFASPAFWGAVVAEVVMNPPLAFLVALVIFGASAVGLGVARNTMVGQRASVAPVNRRRSL